MKILISSCVFGNNVRWNGANKANQEIVDWANRIGIELVPVCPEDELFSTPRQPIRLRSQQGRVVATMGLEDVSDVLTTKAKDIYERHPDAVGFIGISKSPSCGVSVGVKGHGSTVKAPMHEHAPVPTVEINSLKTGRDRTVFLDRVVKHFVKKV